MKTSHLLAAVPLVAACLLTARPISAQSSDSTKSSKPTTSTKQHPSKKTTSKKSTSSKSEKSTNNVNRTAGTPPAPAFTVPQRADAILPKKRIVVYYGNPLSKKMGVLGEYPEPVMLAKLKTEVDAFAKADSTKPVQPGLHLIVSVAQGAPGKNGLYRLRMTDSLIDHWCKLAESKGYLMFLDVQVGRSTVQAELQPLIPYLKRPYVHLALDPEFAMKGDNIPGRKIGTMDASEINYAINLLANLVKANNLPPKILVVHRFTQKMVTNYRAIKPVPDVQVVMNMDGFGAPWLKRDSYNAYERMQPVQFTGFKLFYKNDKPMLTRKEVVQLDPSPVFITFQ